MATASAPQVQTSGLLSYADYGCSHWLGCAASPKEEARSLFAMIGRNGDTIESIRELIAVPPLIEHALGLYARRFPDDAPGIEKVLRFRKRVRAEFDRLVRESDKPVAVIEPETSDRSEDGFAASECVRWSTQWGLDRQIPRLQLPPFPKAIEAR